MVDPIEIVSQAMREDTQKINVVSHNVANVNSTGFKAQLASFPAERPLSETGTVAGAERRQSFNFSDGHLIKTGRNLDLAVTGNGFLALDDAQGKKQFTRNGSLAIDHEGYLVSAATGARIVGERGTLFIGDENVEIRRDGTFMRGQQSLGKLSLYQPLGEVTSVGQGIYQAQEYRQVEDGFSVIQGSLETSNVDIAAEMLQLMTTQKHFGLVQRYFVAYDEQLKNGISQIGK
ncbi:flagellar hook basal-body protein [Vibrio sp. MEBiC08052]|uniref:flagellar hook basal-body protein n=1 Tax=Vibrio sp. MEBiC08052 TaxID=1761910 RepID=UPI00074080FF|nr:flagellar hook basal-body protein [Vibrio sp. MEBiC08052]KUI97028.1 hypothetical protein VRK_38830 [Vibrio sp. MEBiC08052]